MLDVATLRKMESKMGVFVKIISPGNARLGGGGFYLGCVLGCVFVPGLQLPVLGLQAAVIAPQLRVFVEQLLQLHLLPLLQRRHPLVVPPQSFHPGHGLLPLPRPHLGLGLQSRTPGLALAAARQHCCMLGALGCLVHLYVCVQKRSCLCLHFRDSQQPKNLNFTIYYCNSS